MNRLPCSRSRAFSCSSRGDIQNRSCAATCSCSTASFIPLFASLPKCSDPTPGKSAACRQRKSSPSRPPLSRSSGSLIVTPGPLPQLDQPPRPRRPVAALAPPQKSAPGVLRRAKGTRLPSQPPQRQANRRANRNPKSEKKGDPQVALFLYSVFSRISTGTFASFLNFSASSTPPTMSA